MMQKQKIRFLVLSDTHDHAFPDPASLPAVDVIIHCGDLAMIGGLSNYRRALDSLAACAAEIKLVIPGNHDVSLDAEWWDENLDSDDEEDEPVRARALFTLDEYTRRGVRFLDEGTHEVTLRDGRKLKVYASQYTPSFGGYAFGYGPDEDRFNGEQRNIPDDNDIDMVITHGPPQPVDLVSRDIYRLDLGGGPGGGEQQHLGCPRLWQAIARVRPKMHCFGHIHEGYGAQIATFYHSKAATVTDVEAAEEEGLPYVSNASPADGEAMQRKGLPHVDTVAPPLPLAEKEDEYMEERSAKE
ncbi:hypothetical protein LLEC1_07992 [Akanthomyces lecanii]|uniref:Calcineurin-like phosphoesterase domain-containing protein n=1 Tax=Cordyceps confragosa TaxID=2714763 RepID=A0A179IGQ9_CORDF|nr:hypothetical protein LLEC1_07992 [Akanthomyces lecanii]